MKKKKIVIIVIVSVLVVALAIAAIVVYPKLPQPLNYPIDEIQSAGASDLTVFDEETDSVSLKKNAPGDFKILFFTDMHLDGKNETSYRTVERMVDAVQNEKPDLVLLGGDNITSGLNKKRSNQLAEIFEKLGVYWGGVLGNHEGDNSWSISREEMVDIFSSYDHCIMRKGPEEIDGNCNYVIKLFDSNDKLVKCVFCLDTFDEINDEQRATLEIIPDKDYDGCHENQVEWYKTKAKELKKEYEGGTSIMLLHIPLPAYDKGLKKGKILYGVKNEGPCSTAYENGLFDAIKEVGFTQAVYCGHDHINNFGVEYKGIILSYIEMSGYSSYGMKKRGAPESEWLQGYTVLDMNADGLYEHSQKLYAKIYGD